MELRIKQRVFSWSDTYDVYNENGEPCYYVRAEILTFGHQIHVYDKRTGREVGSIHQKLFAFLPQFHIVIGGRVVGTIRRELSFLKPRYTVDFRGWSVEGNFLGWDYTASRNGLQVLSVTKELFTWGDTYVLRYFSMEDEIPGLLLTIAIDAANCDNND